MMTRPTPTPHDIDAIQLSQNQMTEMTQRMLALWTDSRHGRAVNQSGSLRTLPAATEIDNIATVADPTASHNGDMTGYSVFEDRTAPDEDDVYALVPDSEPIDEMWNVISRVGSDVGTLEVIP